MKRILVLTAFMLAMLAWAAAQQSGGKPGSNDQNMPPSSSPGASQTQPTTPGTAGQNTPDTTGQTGAAGQNEAANAPITQGCLGGSASSYTLTDKAGKSYKLNIPANADASALASHIGESVLVLGPVNNAGGSPSIDVEKIARGTGSCQGSTSAAPPTH